MTFKQIEKEFDELFVKKVMLIDEPDKLAYEEMKYQVEPEAIKSFLKQSFIKYLKDECERLSKHEKVCLDECQLDSTGDCNCGMLAYNQAIDDQITHITNQIRELEK